MRKIIVLGDANVDFVINLIRVPNKGEKVPAGTLATYLGGQAVNQVVAAKRAGGKAELYSKLGNDVFAGLLEGMLVGEGIGLKGLFKDNKLQSGTVVAFIGQNGETVAAAVRGAYFDLKEKEVDGIKLDGSEIVISQLLMPHKVVLRFLKRAGKMGCTTVLNCSPQIKTEKELLSVPDYLIMNETELAFHTGSSIDDCVDPKKIAKISEKIRRKGQTIIVTLGKDGVFVVGDKIEKKINGYKVRPIDTIGAGDCLIGAFASCLARGDSIEYSLMFANAAAAISVTRPGASAAMPYEDEIKKMLKGKF